MNKSTACYSVENFAAPSFIFVKNDNIMSSNEFCDLKRPWQLIDQIITILTAMWFSKRKSEPKKPHLYRVLMLNDDYTPMEFVVMVLQRFFGHDSEAAQRIMLHVHQRGVGVCGVFTFDIAETKATQVMNFARQNEHPLQLQIEKE